MRLLFVGLTVFVRSVTAYNNITYDTTISIPPFILKAADADIDTEAITSCAGTNEHAIRLGYQVRCEEFATLLALPYEEISNTFFPRGCYLFHNSIGTTIYFNTRNGFMPWEPTNTQDVHYRRVCINTTHYQESLTFSPTNPRRINFAPTEDSSGSDERNACAENYLVLFDRGQNRFDDGGYAYPTTIDTTDQAPGRFTLHHNDDNYTICCDYDWGHVWVRTTPDNTELIMLYDVVAQEYHILDNIAHTPSSNGIENFTVLARRHVDDGSCPDITGTDSWHVRPDDYSSWMDPSATPKVTWYSFIVTELHTPWYEPTYAPPTTAPTTSAPIPPEPSLSPTIAPTLTACKRRYFVDFQLANSGVVEPPQQINRRQLANGDVVEFFPQIARGIYSEDETINTTTYLQESHDGVVRTLTPKVWKRVKNGRTFYLYNVYSVADEDYTGMMSQWILMENQIKVEPHFIVMLYESVFAKYVDTHLIRNEEPVDNFRCPSDFTKAALHTETATPPYTEVTMTITEATAQTVDFPDPPSFSPTRSPTKSPSTADRSFCEPEMDKGEQCPSSLQGSTGSTTKADIASGLVLAPVYTPGSINGNAFYFCKEPRNTLAGATHHMCLGCDVFLISDTLFKTHCKPFQCAAFQTHACDTNECHVVNNECAVKCSKYRHIENIDDGHRVVIGVYYRHLPNPTVTGVGHQNLICSKYEDQIMFIKVRSKIDNTETTQTYVQGMLNFSNFTDADHVSIHPAPAPASPVTPPTISPTVYRPYTTIKYEETRDELRDLYLWLFVGVVSASVLYGAINSLKHCRGTVKVNSEATFVEKMYVVKDHNFF